MNQHVFHSSDQTEVEMKAKIYTSKISAFSPYEEEEEKEEDSEDDEECDCDQFEIDNS